MLPHFNLRPFRVPAFTVGPIRPRVQDSNDRGSAWRPGRWRPTWPSEKPNPDRDGRSRVLLALLHHLAILEVPLYHHDIRCNVLILDHAGLTVDCHKFL